MRSFDRSMVLAGVFAFAFPVSVTLIVNRGHWGHFTTWLVSQDGSGWFQAFGSVASILFSGWFVAQQISANRALEEERRRADRLHATIRACRTMLYIVLRIRRSIRPLLFIVREEHASAAQVINAADMIESAKRAVDKVEISSLDVELTKKYFVLEVKTEVLPRRLRVGDLAGDKGRLQELIELEVADLNELRFRLSERLTLLEQDGALRA